MSDKPQNGKGSKSRVTKKYQENFDSIDWSQTKTNKKALLKFMKESYK